MNRITLALALCLSWQVSASSSIWLTVGKSGVDSKGRSGFESFEVLPDGRMKWETASMGENIAAGCGAGGGRFEGRIEAAVSAELEKLARAAIRSQPPLKIGSTPPPRSARSMHWSVSLSVGSEFKNDEIRRSTPEWEKLLQRLRDLRTELTPVAAVSIGAKLKKKNLLEVKFSAPGTEEIEVLLPETASEAFKVSGYKVSYSAKPGSSSLILRVGRSQASVRLRLKAIAGAGRPLAVNYTNALIRHHGEGESLEGELAPVELNLCAPIK